MEEKNDFQSAYDAGILASPMRTIDGHHFVVVPEGARVEDIEKFQPEPSRRRGTNTVRDTASFIRMVNEDADPDGLCSRIYGTIQPPSFTAVLNDNVGVVAGWRDDRIHYSCPLSVEWKTWTERSGKPMSQEQFAQFIEDNLPDIAQPPAAEMLEISRTLEAKKKVNFASGIRLSNGQNELTYEETISGTAGRGKFVVPEEFTVGIPVLENGARYAVTARLRYRIGDGGKLTMWFELLRPHKIVEDAVAAVWNEIEAGTEMTIINGAPSA